MASLSPRTLSQEDLNFLRNYRINFESCPLVYQTIIEWGFEKPDGMTIKKHFENMKIEERSGIKLEKKLKKHFIKMEETDFSSFDVTFLHDLLPVLCYEKVTQTGSKDWNEKLKDTDSIEYLLKEIKDFRNEVSHDHTKAKQDPKIEDKKTLMTKCIVTAGTLYGKDKSEIDAKVTDLIAKFNQIMHETSSYKNAVKHVTELIEKESVPSMQKRYFPSFTVPLPGGLKNVGTEQIFESVNLSVAVEDNDETNNQRNVTVEDENELKKEKRLFFSSTELCNHVTTKFVVINGGPGSGKTTLMRNLYQNFLDNSLNESEMSYKGISKFRIPIYLECRTERQNNLSDFLKENIPNMYSPKEVIFDAFKEVEGKVFLIDGYDEVNVDSRKLVDEIIPFCSKYDATCIVSSRVDAGNDFISKLKERCFEYKEILIEPINELRDKLSFLRRYGDKMGDDVNSEELVKSFENLNEAAQRVFFSPVLLALFISLFINNRKSLSQLHNEQNAYKAIRGIFSKEIEKKLRESNVQTPKRKIKYIFDLFSHYSLMLFNCEKYFFEEDDYESLVEKCQKKLSRDVDIGRLLTCILTPEISLRLGKALTYAFTHSTIQEYLAVDQVIKNMEKRNIGSNSWLTGIDWNSRHRPESDLRKNFLKCLGVSTENTDVRKEVKRYGNIIKLLILETSEKGELAKYTKTFTAVLRKYFEPDSDYLLDLVSSSNCASAIVSIVSDVRRYNNFYRLRYSRHIRPLTQELKKIKTKVVIVCAFAESLTDTDFVNLGQLVSVLEVDSEITLNFDHSYDKYQPLNGEFYTQLKNSKCKITGFTACVTSSEHLDIVKRVYRGDEYGLSISTLPTCDVNFATLEGYRFETGLRVKYTEDCSKTGSNPILEDTNLTITDIPADGRETLFNIMKYLCPKSRQFTCIYLGNCHLTDSDANVLLKELKGEKIRTRWGGRTEVMEICVNEDKSRDLKLYLE